MLPGELPRIFTEGQGRDPTTVAQQAALVCLPFFLGVAVALECLGGTLFLMAFGGRARRGAS